MLIGLVLYLFLRCLDLLIAYFLSPVEYFLNLSYSGGDVSIAALLWACGLVPVLEELVFRRLIYRGLRRFMSVAAATIVTTSLFTLAHYQYFGTIYIVSTFVAGLVCQLLCNRSGLAAAVGCHMACNMAVSLRKPSVSHLADPLGLSGAAIPWLALALAALFGLVIYRLLRRMLAPTPLGAS